MPALHAPSGLPAAVRAAVPAEPVTVLPEPACPPLEAPLASTVLEPDWPTFDAPLAPAPVLVAASLPHAVSSDSTPNATAPAPKPRTVRHFESRMIQNLTTAKKDLPRRPFAGEVGERV